jgi:alpha-galactosidase
MMIAVVVGLMSGGAVPSWAKPLKVFILAGQSNMQGHANVSTLDSMADDPQTAPILKEMRNPDGTPRVCEKVWISSVGCAGDGWSDVIEQTGRLTTGFGASPTEIGPEFTFGIYMEKLLGEPILLIKTSWGGRSLHTDFRPPSAGPETFNDYIMSQWKQRGLDANKESERILKDGGVFYRHMIEHVKMVLADIKRVVPDYDPKQGYELAGFVWFQGWNDLVDSWTYNNRMKPGGYDLYSQLLTDLIRDVRKDLNAPKLPFVIGVIGIGGVKEGEKPPQLYFRQAQAAPALLPEFQGNVVAVQTAPFWDDDLDALQQRMEKFNAKMDQEAEENPGLSREARDEARKKAKAETFTPEESKRLKGISNGGYHYLGAAKILAPIGKAFAEAIIGMTRADGRLGEMWKQANELIYAGMNGTFNRVTRPAPQEERRTPERWGPEQEWIGHSLGRPRFTQTDPLLFTRPQFNA